MGSGIFKQKLRNMVFTRGIRVEKSKFLNFPKIHYSRPIFYADHDYVGYNSKKLYPGPVQPEIEG